MSKIVSDCCRNVNEVAEDDNKINAKKGIAGEWTEWNKSNLAARRQVCAQNFF